MDILLFFFFHLGIIKFCHGYFVLVICLYLSMKYDINFGFQVLERWGLWLITVRILFWKKLGVNSLILGCYLDYSYVHQVFESKCRCWRKLKIKGRLVHLLKVNQFCLGTFCRCRYWLALFISLLGTNKPLLHIRHKMLPSSAFSLSLSCSNVCWDLNGYVRTFICGLLVVCLCHFNFINAHVPLIFSLSACLNY